MNRKYQMLWFGLVILISAIAVHVTGGDLNPGNTPSPTMRTLDELYKNIQPGLPSDWVSFPHEGQVTGASAIHLSLEINGSPVPGSVTAERKEGTIRIVGLGHELSLPYDPATGQITGMRQHGPIILTKYVDQSSPLLYKALCNNELVNEAALKFYRMDAGDREDQYYTIFLENARIVNIKTAFPNIEQISFLYQKIRWTWEEGGIEYQDEIGNPGS